MSNAIEKKKPSQLNEFQGDFTGDEIMQVTRAGVGTYRTSTKELKNYFGGAPVVLTQAQYDALLVKDENTTYYIIEE